MDRASSYDRAGGRITAIHDGSNCLLKSFSYGMSSTTANREIATPACEILISQGFAGNQAWLPG